MGMGGEGRRATSGKENKVEHTTGTDKTAGEKREEPGPTCCRAKLGRYGD